MYVTLQKSFNHLPGPVFMKGLSQGLGLKAQNNSGKVKPKARLSPFVNIRPGLQLCLSYDSGYRSDIVCLQEVDSKVFKRQLIPVLTNHGYEGLHKAKTGDVKEGASTFFRTEKFR